MNDSGKSGHGHTLPAWWPTFLGFMGVGMAWWEVVADHFDRPWLYVLVGVLCAGMPAQLIVAVTDWLVGRRDGRRDA